MFLITVYNSPIIKVNLQKKHFCHAKIFQTMTLFIMFFISLDSQWIGLHQVFGLMLQKLLNISFIIENFNELKKTFWENWGMFFKLLKSHEWSIGNIKSWVIFVSRISRTNNNNKFDFRLRKTNWGKFWCFWKSSNE
jgi:hypothetical protein